MTLNKKKSPKHLSLLRLGQPNTPSWLSNSQSARETARVAGTLFSVKPAQLTARLPEEPLTSEIQALLNSVTSVIECATGGHGRCANSACRCRCHKSRGRTPESRGRTRAKRRISI
jgi:hypothetical protein